MADYLIQDSTLTDIADAIRAKTGGSSAMTPAEMVTAIGSIPSGGGSQITKDEWTLASDYNGTTQGFYYGTNYIDRTFVGVQIIHIDGNTASSNAAKGVYIDNHYSAETMNVYFRGTSFTVMSSGQLYNISAGATITRYKIPSDAFPT